MTLKNNRSTSPKQHQALCIISSPYVNSQIGVTVWKRLSGVMTSVTLTFDLWPSPVAWTSRLSMVLTPENFRMIRWQEHCTKRCDGRTDRRDRSVPPKAAWSQLKTIGQLFYATSSFVHHFVAVGQFKVELQSGTAHLGENRRFFLSWVTSKLYG